MAAPQPVCGQHPVVAAVLRGRRLGCAAIIAIPTVAGVDFG
jgi:hypothetical protein